MSNVADQGLQVQLCHGDGKVQLFVPGEVVTQLTAERDRLLQEVSQLRQQLAAMASAKEEVEAERNQYLHGLRAVMEQDFGLTEQSWIDAMNNRVPADDVIREMEEILGLDPECKDNG